MVAGREGKSRQLIKVVDIRVLDKTNYLINANRNCLIRRIFTTDPQHTSICVNISCIFTKLYLD